MNDRPGNNGTIKVDREPFDSHPNNEPHVGCVFQVDFYNYGEGDFTADVNFAMQAPTKSAELSVTSGDLTPAIGDDRPRGGTDVDAQETYQLSFTGDPHKQGYHVKLTIHAPESRGADTKHKVFWVEPCVQATPTDEETTPTESEQEATPTEDETTPTDEETTPTESEQEATPTESEQEATPTESEQEATPTESEQEATPTEEDGVPADERTQAEGGAPVGGAPPAAGAHQAGPGFAENQPAPRSAQGAQEAAPRHGADSGAPPADVPTEVDAGLTGEKTVTDPTGAALAASLLGLCMLLAAATAGAAFRRRGDHQV